MRLKPSGSFAPARHRAHQAEAGEQHGEGFGFGNGRDADIVERSAVGILGTECCEAEVSAPVPTTVSGVLLPVVGAGVVGAAQRGAVLPFQDTEMLLVLVGRVEVLGRGEYQKLRCSAGR